jgi:hypothetical protein
MIEMVCNNKRYKNSKHYTVLLSDCDKDLSEMLWTVVGPGYAYSHANGLLHRVILSRMLGRPLVKGEETDHVNRNKLDNRRENIRLADSSQNKINRALQKNNTTGYRGIWLQCDGKKWGATLHLHGKKHHLGVFPTKEEAAAAYDKAAKEEQGEFFIGNES